MEEWRAANRRRTRRLRAAFIAVVAVGAVGLVYLFTSDDPASRYAFDTISEPRARPFRVPESDADRRREREAGERLAQGLATGGGGSGDAGGAGDRLLTRDGLAGALDLVGRRGSRLVSLVAGPSSVDAVVVTAGGRLRSVRVTAAGAEVQEGGQGPPAGVPLPAVADLDAAAPGRLARSAGGRARTATVTAVGATVRWTVTLDDGRTVTGDAAGRPR